jgi:hypothetical protein
VKHACTPVDVFETDADHFPGSQPEPGHTQNDRAVPARPRCGAVE